MRKVLSFSAFLMMGLLVSQILPGAVGEGYTTIKSVSDVLLYICLSFIMINVGREFVMDKQGGRVMLRIILLQWLRQRCHGF